MVVEYRLDEMDGQTWHFCAACSRWPSDSFNVVVLERLPPDFAACDECSALQRQGGERIKRSVMGPAGEPYPEHLVLFPKGLK